MEAGDPLLSADYTLPPAHARSPDYDDLDTEECYEEESLETLCMPSALLSFESSMQGATQHSLHRPYRGSNLDEDDINNDRTDSPSSSPPWGDISQPDQWTDPSSDYESETCHRVV